MRFQLLISCNNAAFGNNLQSAADEVMRIMRALSINREFGDNADGLLRDVNGNTVGTWAFVDDLGERAI